MTLALLTAGMIWIALTIYGVLGGADFGGGIWDLLATGPTAERQRRAIAHALGPVWEANNVWLVYVIVGAFTCFPIVFSTLSQALFIPLTIALIGIVLRGAAFVFRSFATQTWTSVLMGRVFSAASTITPFVFGMCAAAIASGQIHVANDAYQNPNYWSSWTTPFAFSCGAFALGICSCLAATYMTVEARLQHEDDLANDFLFRALAAGAVAALAGAMALALASNDAPILYHGLITRALPITLGAMIIGLITAGTLIFQRFMLARGLLIAEIVAIFLAWAIAQTPALIIPDVTIDNAVSSSATLEAFLIASCIGAVLLLPSLWFLFSVFKSAGGNQLASPNRL
jgi:cytochrome bd ubiquinol oxidase subunit II